MKLKFKKQAYQTNAVEAVTDCFLGQLKVNGTKYRIDPGRVEDDLQQKMLDESGFKNSKIAMPQSQVLENIQAVQRRQNLPISTSLVSNKICPINLDIEMEIKQSNGIKRVIRKLGKNDNLFDKSEGLNQYKTNPEDFILKAARIINEQKATVIVEHLAYDPVDATHHIDIFTQEKQKEDFSKAFKADRHIYDYVFTDSKNERTFVKDLDKSTEVVVYAKLPRSFFIPTPVGNYNPDWAIAFKEGKVKHIYFIAETKGSMSTMDLREIEKSKIECARKFFTKITSDQVKYDVVDSYGKLMELVH